MLLRTLPLGSLKPAPYNPRKPLPPGCPGYRRLAKSIAEFDLVQPVVWNERSGHVVAGHQRLQVLKDRGATEVDCVVVDLSPEKEKALNVALNNTQVGSDWDDARLHDLLAGLAELPGFDATLTGFDEDELADLLLRPAPEPQPLPASDDHDRDTVQVTLLVPSSHWETLRPELDRLASAHPVQLHVRLPQ